MMETIIGKHNTMTYLKPNKWWMKLFNWVAKCQNTSYRKRVFDTGKVECCDIRVYWDKEWKFAHGLVDYNCNENGIKLTISSVIKPYKYVRIMLERAKDETDKNRFKDLCRSLEVAYPNKTFLCGRYKKGWELIYDFGTDNIPVYQYISSMAKNVRWYERIFPKLYSKRCTMNKEKALLKEGINLFDFIQ